MAKVCHRDKKNHWTLNCVSSRQRQNMQIPKIRRDIFYTLSPTGAAASAGGDLSFDNSSCGYYKGKAQDLQCNGVSHDFLTPSAKREIIN